MYPKITDKTEVASLVALSKDSQRKISQISQEEIDLLVFKLGLAMVNPEFGRLLSRTLVEESGMGKEDDKYAKIQNKVRGVLWDLKGQLSVGVVEHNKELGLMKIAKPVGSIAAVIPITNGEATPLVKALSAIKTRNSIIFAPHPKGVRTVRLITELLRSLLKDSGYPEDLILMLDPVSLEGTKKLMQHCDLIVATGGPSLVKEAYSSGTPAYGVGAGNAVSVIDSTCDTNIAAQKIALSKTFDYATSCSTENSLAIESCIYDQMIASLTNQGGILLSKSEKQKLQDVLWVEGVLNRNLVASSAQKIAKAAGIEIDESKSFFLVEETGIGLNFPFSQEKLSVIAAVYRWETFDEAISLVNEITSFSGPGHSCGIHSQDERRIRKLGMQVQVSRIMVNQPQCLANSGSWTNGMPMSLTLGCGTWGGNVSSSNITWRNMLNYTWVSFPISNRQGSDEELFGEFLP